MGEQAEIRRLLDVAQEIMNRAGCAALLTIDEFGLPSSRAVRTFASDKAFSRILIPTHPASRKTAHVRVNAGVALSYIDEPARAYVTFVGKAALNDRSEDKSLAWLDAFSAFWPEGPDSDEFMLIEFTPERIELRSFTQGVAADPTRWMPAILERTSRGDWEQRQ